MQRLPLLALSCSALALLLTGCRHRIEEPRLSIKDAPLTVTDRTDHRPVVRTDVKRSRTVDTAALDVTETSGASRSLTLPTAGPAPASITVPTTTAAIPAASERPDASERSAAGEQRAALRKPDAPSNRTLPEPARSDDAAAVRVIGKARERLATGDVIRAREWLLSGLNGGRPAVLHELARTFDPNFLARVSQANATPEPSRARALYEEAIRLGADAASIELANLTRMTSKQR